MTAIVEKANAQKSRNEEEITTSSGNVYEDLGLAHPDERMAKSVIALAITDAIKARNLTQATAAELMNADASQLSDLQRGRLTHIPFDCLLRFANALGLGVQITIQPTNDEQGKTSAHTMAG